MAQGVAIAVAMGIVINRPRRKPNIFRQAYVSNEVDYAAMRLNQHELHQLYITISYKHMNIYTHKY
jgi:hypothetical protein